jgi:hypothetical protein
MTISIKRLTSSMVAALALFTGAVATPAAAHTTVIDAAAQSATKTVTAKGIGSAIFQGSGTITISGNGELRYKDEAGDAQIVVSGNARRTAKSERGWTRYGGFRGSVTITGTNVTVQLTGTSVNLNASGTGRFILRGKGTANVTVDGVTTTTEWSGAQWRTL